MNQMSYQQIEFETWYETLKPVLESPMFRNLTIDLENEYVFHGARGKLVIPQTCDIFNAFKKTTVDNFKVLIIGQDPYPVSYNATGIAFGVPEQCVSIPPSLMNLIQEVERSTGTLCLDFDYTLESWCRQGVLLLNSSLTVVEGKPGSHEHLWYNFITSVIEHIIAKFPYHPVITFGKKAESVLSGYSLKYAQVLKSPHPAAAAYGRSPGALGSNVFVNANYILSTPEYRVNKEVINWATIKSAKKEYDGEPF